MVKSKFHFLPHKFLLWVIFSVLISAFCGLIYTAVQQDMRIGANDPQIQIAEDSAVALDAGQKVTPTGSVDVATSLAPFVILYNTQGKIVSSEAKLNGQTPELPAGVLDNVKSNGEARFTWQPQQGVRIAAIVTQYSNGYVLAGRSLREVEKRIDNLGLQVGAVWVGSMTLITILSALL